MIDIDKLKNDRDGRTLVVFESILVGSVFALAIWSIRPLLEEWVAFVAFNTFGTGVLASHFAASPLRPLHVVPYWLQWIAAGGTPVGVGIFCGLLMALRYLVVRWAVSPLLTGSGRVIFALLCTVCVGWQALWLGRFSPAQISSIFFFAALGFSIRLSRRASFPHAAGATASIMLMLPVYQAPLLVAGLFPFMAAFGFWSGKSQGSALRRFVRVGAPLLLGVMAYVIYCAIMYTNTRIGYEAELAFNESSGLWRNVTQIYRAIFLVSPQTVALYGFILYAFSKHGVQDQGTTKLRSIWPYLAIFVLPLLSLIYTSRLHTNDPERVLFPFFLGFCLLALQALKRQDPPVSYRDGKPMLLLALPILAWATVCAIEARSAWTLQSYVVRTTAAFATVHKATSVAIIDETGLLGDVYSLLGDTLTRALKSQGQEVDTTICTPLDVDRLHPVAQRYPISTTPRCDGDVGSRESTLVLLARTEDGRLRLAPR